MSALVDSLHRLPQSPTAARAIAAALAAVLLVQLARVLALALGDADLPLPEIAPAPAAAAREPLARWHLFGLPGNAPQAASETTLALTLRGTVASPDPARGTAFIADAEGRDGVYRVGQALPGGGVLEAVYAGRVILNNNGQRETLALRGHRGGTAMAGNDKPEAGGAAPPRLDGGYLTGGLAFGAPDLETQRALRAPDLELRAEQGNILPVLENGRVIGVRLSVPDPALLDRVGLQRDDVVTSVNGITLDDPALAPELQKQLRAGGLLTLTVRRDGQDLTLTLGL